MSAYFSRYFCPSVFRSICLFIHHRSIYLSSLYLPLSVRLSVSLFASFSLSDCLYVSLSDHLSLCLTDSVSVFLFASNCLPICLFLLNSPFLSVCLSIYLSFSLSLSPVLSLSSTPSLDICINFSPSTLSVCPPQRTWLRPFLQSMLTRQFPIPVLRTAVDSLDFFTFLMQDYLPGFHFGRLCADRDIIIHGMQLCGPMREPDKSYLDFKKNLIKEVGERSD